MIYSEKALQLGAHLRNNLNVIEKPLLFDHLSSQTETTYLLDWRTARFECRIKNAVYAPPSITMRAHLVRAGGSCSRPIPVANAGYFECVGGGETVQLVCEGLPTRRLHVSITVFRTASVKPVVSHPANHDRAGRRQMRPMPRRWATNWREPISESRSAPQTSLAPVTHPLW